MAAAETMIPLLTVAAVVALAFANGANDVSKGVATLAGSGRATYREALAWGAVWTAAGAFAAIVISAGLVKVFTSSLVTNDVLQQSSFALAVAIGAAAWVLFASATGWPVSTTHAITGAIVGVALLAGGTRSIHWELLVSSIAAPLAVSPFVSAVLGYSLHGVAARIDRACACADVTAAPARLRAISALKALRFIQSLLSSFGLHASAQPLRGTRHRP